MFMSPLRELRTISNPIGMIHIVNPDLNPETNNKVCCRVPSERCIMLLCSTGNKTYYFRYREHTTPESGATWSSSGSNLVRSRE